MTKSMIKNYSRILSSKSSKSSSVFSSSSSCGFLAGLTYQSNNLSFDEQYELASEVPEEEIKEWEEGHYIEHGQKIVYGSKYLTVLDSEMKSDLPNTYMRSLHFNDRVDLRQSAIIRNGSIFNWQNVSDNHVKALSMGIAFSKSLYPNNENPTNIAVLGGGGCVLPGFLHEVFSDACRVKVVERSQEIVHVAHDFFGISQIESSTFELICDCAKNWVSKQDRGSVDLLIVDIESGNPEREDWILPPIEFVSKPFLDPHVTKILSKECGILCFKTIASENAFHEMICSVKESGFRKIIKCKIPGTVREHVAFCSQKEELNLSDVRKSLREMLADHFDVDSFVFSYG